MSIVNPEVPYAGLPRPAVTSGRSPDGAVRPTRCPSAIATTWAAGSSATVSTAHPLMRTTPSPPVIGKGR